eukprot:COSAG02_NODE_1389_length_12913_cov_414.638889_13_plen_82_part_00
MQLVALESNVHLRSVTPYLHTMSMLANMFEHSVKAGCHKAHLCQLLSTVPAHVPLVAAHALYTLVSETSVCRAWAATIQQM